jgi:phenylacetate-coenzyme A ligase PaaK-like adenylate-forming protein
MRMLALPRHDGAHWSRVKREAAAMIADVPLYAGRAAPPASEEPEAIAGWLATLATVSKRDLRRGFPKALVRRTQDLKAALADGSVEVLATSGTTEQRLQVLWEDAWWDPQEREAMRLNARVRDAMAGEYREAVLTTPVCGGATCHIGNLSRAERTIDGMLFLNQVADPTHWNAAELDRMIAEWNDLRPVGVEADPAYLAALCRHVARAGGALCSPAYVQLTYELATRGQKRAIARVLDSPLYDLYGATEAGVLFMQCASGRLHHNTRHSHIELEDVGGGLGRVLVTTLGRAWMPLLRYDVGDFVRLAPGACSCGRDDGGYVLARVEGRSSDCVRHDAHGWVTPAMLDDAIDGAEPAVESWQLDVSARRLHVVGPETCDGRAAADAASALLGAAVEPAREVAILPEGSGKYRLVRPCP